MAEIFRVYFLTVVKNLKIKKLQQDTSELFIASRNLFSLGTTNLRIRNTSTIKFDYSTKFLLYLLRFYYKQMHELRNINEIFSLIGQLLEVKYEQRVDAKNLYKNFLVFMEQH